MKITIPASVVDHWLVPDEVETACTATQGASSRINDEGEARNTRFIHADHSLFLF